MSGFRSRLLTTTGPGTSYPAKRKKPEPVKTPARISQNSYSDFLPAAFTLAQRALAAAAIWARPSALMPPFFFGAGLTTALTAGLAPLTFAHRAFCAAATLARPAALMPPIFFGALATVAAVEPRSWLNWFSKAEISSFRSAAWRSCCADKLIELIYDRLSPVWGD